MKSILISVPSYNEEANIYPLYEAIQKVTEELRDEYSFEILFVNDGSSDDTVDVVKKLISETDNVALLNLSRNYGKEIAMAAGFDYSTHDAVITIDADLQHPPMLIKDMINLWNLGYEDIYAKRNERHGESFFKKSTSKLFYKILQNVSDMPVNADAGDYRLLDRKVVDALKKLRESQRYTKGLYNWVGFKKAAIEFDAAERLHGETKWNLRSLVKLAMEGITSYTTAPLKISMYFGFIVSLVAFIYMIYIIVKTLLIGSDVSGFPTIMIVMLFLGGCQLISIGILGEYLGRIFNETKHRPLYFLEETITKSTKVVSTEEAHREKSTYKN